MPSGDGVYLTTAELADLLRIKERKVYDLAASGKVPHTKAMGKLLFARTEIDAWLKRHSTGSRDGEASDLPCVVLGSHDPVLDWAIRESGCGMATLFDGSHDGIERFARGEGIAAGIHIHDAATDGWNDTVVRERFAAEPVVLAQWARRSRGLIVQPGRTGQVSLRALAGQRVMMRQASAGSQTFFETLLAQNGTSVRELVVAGVARTETEAALAVFEGKADVAFGLRQAAVQHRLDFVPVAEERFDLLVDRRSWFEPPFQEFLSFCRSARFGEHVAGVAGYDFTGLGTIRFNGA